MNDDGWHLDKRITVGHIMTTAVVATSVFLYVTSVETRVALLETRQDLQASHHAEQLKTISGQLIRIEAKLDRKVDK